MSVPTTYNEVTMAIKELKQGLKDAMKDMTVLTLALSKTEGKLEKTEGKLEKEKVKTGGKKAPTATATAATATAATESSSSSNSASASAAASSSASESGSESSTKPLTVTAARATAPVQRLLAMMEQLDVLTVLVKILAKPVKPVKSGEPKAPTNAHIAWQPATLYPAEWEAFKEESKPAKAGIAAQIAALDPADTTAIADLKKRQRQIGSVMAFNALCREVTHKANWDAFQEAWAVEHPKKPMGGGGSM